MKKHGTGRCLAASVQATGDASFRYPAGIAVAERDLRVQKYEVSVR